MNIEIINALEGTGAHCKPFLTIRLQGLSDVRWGSNESFYSVVVSDPHWFRVSQQPEVLYEYFDEPNLHYPRLADFVPGASERAFLVYLLLSIDLKKDKS